MYLNHRPTLFVSALLLLLLLVVAGAPEEAVLSAPRAQALPTAGPCDPATAYARAGANVREGPGPEYPRIEQLTSGEVRRVTGRHAGFRWWQIETADGSLGWVWDSAVTVTGNVLAVPVVEAPPLNGVVPPTDAVWELAGAQACIPTPTVTPFMPTMTPQPSVVDWEYADEGWAAPLNLSNAGAAAQPQLVALGDDLLVLWEDTFDGFAFSRRENGLWSAPVLAEFPFFTRRYETGLATEEPTPGYTPQLLARTPDDLYAFWRDEDDNLFASHVATDSFGVYDSWTARLELGTNIAGMAAAVDGDSAIYLAYLQTSDLDGARSGIYVRRLEADAATWSDPQPLHLSGYYRLMTAETANIQVAASETQVFVVWDEQPQERVWLARADAGGDGWQEPVLIDQRQASDSTAATSPGAIHLLLDRGSLHLTWQAGHEGSICTQYHRWSQDNGSTWESTSQLSTAESGLSSGCLQDVSLLGDGETVYMLGSTENNAYLYLWRDGSWTEAQAQPPMQAFTLSSTGRQVAFNCGRDAIVHDDRLVVAACGQAAGQDIWLLSLDLQSYAALLAVTPVWSTPAPLLPVTTDDEVAVRQKAILSPLLIEDDGGQLHAFWIEIVTSDYASVEISGGALFHALRQDGVWSRPQQLFVDSAVAVAQPAVALTASGRLLAVWSGGTTGEIYYSWAAAAQAGAAFEWSEPALLPAPRLAGSFPTIGADPTTGMLYAAYAIPLNEARGIYLTTSTDGENWSEADLVFDAVEAGWKRADRPRLVVAKTGELHLLFWKRSLPGTVPATELYYMRSTDGGVTWSEPEAIHSGTALPGVVVWSDLLVTRGRLVHVVWQEWDATNGTRTLWHRLSSDNGITWAQASRIGGFGLEFSTVALLPDPADGVHVLGLSQETFSSASSGESETRLTHWRWSDEAGRWEQAENLELEALRPGGNQALAGTVTRGGVLVAVLAGETAAGSTQLFSAARTVALPTSRLTSLPTLTPTAWPADSVTPTPTPAPTETPVFPKDSSRGRATFDFLPLAGSGMLVTGAILALIPAILIVLVAIGVVSRVRTKRR